MEGDFLQSEVEPHPKDTEKKHPLSQAKASPQERRAAMRVESAEAEDFVSALQWIEEEMEEPSFIPSAVSEPRWALHMCADKCREEGFELFQIAAIVTEGEAVRTIIWWKQCYKVRRLKQGEREVTASKWRVDGRAEGLSSQAVGSILHGTTRAQNVGTFHHQKKAFTISFLEDAESERHNGTEGR